ncbi:hypothetical protein [Acinetobacter bereziniae]|nr:hypothetical protein ACINWC743_0086 [Acinetobacter sp. WC-743]CEI52351.1 hypothetical protein [Acinetobacter bereziniae]
MTLIAEDLKEIRKFAVFLNGIVVLELSFVIVEPNFQIQI